MQSYVTQVAAYLRDECRAPKLPGDAQHSNKVKIAPG